MSVRFVGHDVTVDRSEFLVVWGVGIIAIGLLNRLVVSRSSRRISLQPGAQ
jgi:hypothetical protein